ncbi:GIY-YIG nuclease family protein [Candidatus Margulisiibacteriota bacterium]
MNTMSFNTREYYVYIITNFSNTALYTGVTNNIYRRMFEHKNRVNKGFSMRYSLTKLVYYEIYDDINYAIEREKQIKKYKRLKKINLIKKHNPQWKDLFSYVVD